MGNRFGIHGLEAASAHSERDVDVGRISDRPIEVPVTESRSEFGSSCHDPEVSKTKSVPRHNGAQAVGQETKNVSCRPADLRTRREVVESSPKRYSSILRTPEDVRIVEISESSTTHTEFGMPSLGSAERPHPKTDAIRVESSSCLLYTSDAADE